MISRRNLLIGLATMPLAACNTTEGFGPGYELSGWYIGRMPDEPFPIPLVDQSRLDPKFRRQTVAYTGGERPGTIVADIDQRFLYLVQPNGKALRYGVGVGRQGFSWRGAAYVGRKAVWPDWTPTNTMLKIRPNLPHHVEGGLRNPLGARALYLYQDGHDTMFRLHGTNEPWSIGKQVSSGCVRLLNEDIHDLYNRVPVGATVLVRRGHRGTEDTRET
jgi:lipoprotein-anchoring transpeptidase ErfK/SrfK